MSACHRCKRRTIARRGRGKHSLCASCRDQHESVSIVNMLVSLPTMLPFFVREDRQELFTQILDEMNKKTIKFIPAEPQPEQAIEPFNGLATQMGDDEPTIVRYEPQRNFSFKKPDGNKQ